jgi:rubrerythrin
METIGDIIRFAIGREVAASEFYLQAAGLMKNPVMKIVCEDLAKVELGHKETLELELMKEGIVAETAGRIPEMDLEDYGFGAELRPDMEYKDILSMAVAKERMSFRLYVRLAGVVQEDAMAETLLQLAEEEARHMAQFESEYARVIAKEERGKRAKDTGGAEQGDS